MIEPRQMDTLILLTIKELRDLRALRRYGDVYRKIDGLPHNDLSFKQLRDIASEKAQTLYQQGYVDRAAREYQEALKYSTLSRITLEDRIGHAILECKEALVMVDSRGQIARAWEIRDRILSSFLTHDTSESMPCRSLVLNHLCTNF